VKKTIILILLISIFNVFGLKLYSINFDDIVDSIEIYVHANIYLNSNTLDLDDILISNNSDKDIYIFWNSFVFQNMIQMDSTPIKKNPYMNELIIYKRGNPVVPNYLDSISIYNPIFIKFPKYNEYKKRHQNKGQSIKVFANNLNKTISYKERNSIELKITFNYLNSEDLNLLKDKYEIDFSERAIIPLDTRISTYCNLEKSFGYIDCFNSTKIIKDLKEFNTIISSLIKEITVIVYPNVFERNTE
jgi:hypothetical protein